jgi:glycosyltransferase involved in cell wall biosynthesis
MRVAIVSDSIFPYNTGGKETRIFELTKRLAAAGLDVHIYTMHWWDDPQRDRIENGVHLHAISPRLPLYSGERRSVRQGILFGMACFRLIKEDFDVVDVDHIPYFPLFSVRLVALLKRRPMLATWHEVWGRDYWREYLGAAGNLAYIIEKLSVMLPTKIIAVSTMTKNRLQGELGVGSSAALVGNGIDLEAIRGVRAKRRGADVVYAGRLLAHKNVDLLLQAVARLKRTQPGISCLIIGDGPERQRLEALARQLGLDGNVRFLGFLPTHSEVFAYLKASKVFVSPSSREGFGISVIEAGACGLPVVTIDHKDNAARHLITPTTGRLAKASAASLAYHISSLLGAPAPAKDIRAAAAAYDWQASAQLLSAEYAS